MNNQLRKSGEQLKRAASGLGICCAAVMGLLGFTSVASAQIVLPDPGVDVAGHVTAGITALGAIVLVAVGGYFAYMVIRFGLRWAKRSAG